MLFNSYIFIFLFLPLCLLGFYILENKQATLAKVWLTCFSLWFYGYFNINYLLIMLCSILGNYVIHSMLMKQRVVLKNNDSICLEMIAKDKKSSVVGNKSLLIIGVGLNLLVLFYFKYYDFFLDNINIL